VYASEVARVPGPVIDVIAAARAEQTPDPAEERRAAVGTLHDFEALTADSVDVARWSQLALPTLLLQGTETWEPVPTSFAALAEALRERGIAELVAQGHSNKQVAGALFLSEKTIQNALTRVYAKLGVRSRTQLTRTFARA
jgi:DNA-binding CsgD family transcriptional regulator